MSFIRLAKSFLTGQTAYSSRPLLRLGLSLFLLVVLFEYPFMSTFAQDLPTDKIEFDLSRISPEGLIGSPDSLRSLRYEFCIPANEQFLAEVRAIAPEIQYYPSSRGRIGCSKEQYLCINETYPSNWQTILLSIAELSYVERIVESFGEH